MYPSRDSLSYTETREQQKVAGGGNPITTPNRDNVAPPPTRKNRKNGRGVAAEVQRPAVFATGRTVGNATSGALNDVSTERNRPADFAMGRAAGSASEKASRGVKAVEQRPDDAASGNAHSRPPSGDSTERTRPATGRVAGSASEKPPQPAKIKARRRRQGRGRGRRNSTGALAEMRRVRRLLVEQVVDALYAERFEASEDEENLCTESEAEGSNVAESRPARRAVTEAEAVEAQLALDDEAHPDPPELGDLPGDARAMTYGEGDEVKRMCRRFRRAHKHAAKRALRKVTRSISDDPNMSARNHNTLSVAAQVKARFREKFDMDFESLTDAERARYYSSVDTELSEVDDEPLLVSDIDYLAILEALDEMAETAGEMGMSRGNVTRLKSILAKYADGFRLGLCNDPPARVKPVKFRLCPGAMPWKCHARKYSAEQKRFLEAFTDRLLNYGFIYKNTDTPYASPVHLVSKKAPSDADILEKFRLTVDLRGPNAITLQKIWAMPRLDDIAEKLKGARFFAKLDLKNAYWSIPVHKDHQNLHSMMTHNGVFSNTRLSQGTMDGGAIFQSAVQQILGDDLIGKGVLLYIDDVLIYAATEEELLDRLETVIQRLEKARLKMSAAKCSLFQREVQWCGFIFNESGRTHDPARIQGLKDWQRPKDGAELWQFTSALGWIRDCCPAYLKRVKPLLDLQQRVLKLGTAKPKRVRRDGKVVEVPAKRNMKAAAAVKLTDDLWTPAMDQAWEAVKEMLCEVTTMTYPDPLKDQCLFTDASNTGWGAMLTQRAVSQRDLELEDQQHEPLAFISKAWDQAALAYSTCDQEAMAIFLAVKRLHPMMHTQKDARLFFYTDHANLRYIFDPQGRGPVPVYTAERLERAAVYLQRFRYTILHIDGAKNVYADMLSRWANPSVVQEVRDSLNARYKRDLYARHVNHPERLVAESEEGDGDGAEGGLPRLRRVTPKPNTALYRSDPYTSIGFGAENIVWPTYQEIKTAQSDVSSVGAGVMVPKGLTNAKFDSIELLTYKGSRIWLPEGDKLRTRVCVLAHCCAAGHRGEGVTCRIVEEVFWWKNMHDEIRGWVRHCLSCSPVRGGKVVPRPSLTCDHVENRLELIHFDFLKMPKSTEGYSSIMVVKDDFTMLTQLSAHTIQDAKAAAKALSKWFSTYGIVKRWQSDAGGHFKNQVMEEIANIYGVKHHFTTAAAPWANGTVEVVNSTILNTFMAILVEKRLAAEEWPSQLEVVTYAINHSPVPRLCHYTPAQVHLGADEGNPLKLWMQPETENSNFGSVRPEGTAEGRILGAVAELVEALDNIHKEVRLARHPEKRVQDVEQAVNFAVGDWVQVARVVTHVNSDKLTPVWQGPVRVHKIISDYRYVVQDETSKKFREVHAARMRYYADGSVVLAPEILDHIAGAKDGYEIDRIHDFRKNNKRWEVELSYCDKSRAGKWVTLQSVAKQAALLLRALTRRKEMRDRKDIEDFKAAMDQLIPKQNRCSRGSNVAQSPRPSPGPPATKTRTRKGGSRVDGRSVEQSNAQRKREIAASSTSKSKRRRASRRRG